METIVRGMKMKFTTKIGKADTRNVSSRTIVPKKIVEALDLDFGDQVEWTIEDVNGSTLVTFAKKPNKSTE